MSKKVSKSVWDSCSTAHLSLTAKMLAALTRIADKKGISMSKAAQMVFLESKTVNVELDELSEQGLFNAKDSKYEQFRKKQEVLKR